MARPLEDRLRASLAAAGVPVTDGDFEQMVQGGYLDGVERIRRILDAADVGEGLPDPLADWGPKGHAGATSRTDGRDSAGLESPSEDAPSEGASTGEASVADLPHTISEMGALIRSGALSPVELTQTVLSRIEARDPELNAFQLVTDERALASARRAEDEIRRGEYRGPLHGIPVAVKDLLAMSGTVTTAGSNTRTEHATDFDAAVIERLRAAGAVIVGKTRLPEFAYWPGSANPHFGPVRNPRGLDRDTGGSSSGSAAAVSDGIVPMALGSDTGGSIRIPAALCGVVGLKPTFGRVSLHGCVPLAWSLDHLGPLTRTVEDSALALSVLAGEDVRDPRTRKGGGFVVPEDLHSGVRGMRVGVMTDDGLGEPLGTDSAMAAWRASNQALVDAGAVYVDVDLSDMTTLRSASSLILAVEAAAYHTENLVRRYEELAPFFRERLMGAFAYGPEDLIRAQRVRRLVREKWALLWDDIEVLSTPCQPGVAPPLGVAASTRFTNPFNALGWPTITVPYGSGEGGLPFGTQLSASPWDEATVLRAAAALETVGAG